MKFLANDCNKDIWFVTDQMADMLECKKIKITDVIKLPEFLDKLVIEDIIKVGHLQSRVAKLFFKTVSNPFVVDAVDEFFSDSYFKVINCLDGENLPSINVSFDKFYVKSIGDMIFVGMTQSNNQNTYFKSDTAYQELNSSTVENALIETLYDKYLYSDLHFKQLIVTKADELCMADMLASFGNVYQ